MVFVVNVTFCPSLGQCLWVRLFLHQGHRPSGATGRHRRTQSSGHRPLFVEGWRIFLLNIVDVDY